MKIFRNIGTGARRAEDAQAAVVWAYVWLTALSGVGKGLKDRCGGDVFGGGTSRAANHKGHWSVIRIVLVNDHLVCLQWRQCARICDKYFNVSVEHHVEFQGNGGALRLPSDAQQGWKHGDAGMTKDIRNCYGGHKCAVES
jgi:hypothetical protein